MAKEAGYMWIRQPEGSGVYRVAPWPGRVVLAVMPGIEEWGQSPFRCKRGRLRTDPTLLQRNEECPHFLLFSARGPFPYKRARTMQRQFSWQSRVLPRPPLFLAACGKKEARHRRRPWPKKPSLPNRPEPTRAKFLTQPLDIDIYTRRPVGARVQRQDLHLSLARLRLGHPER